MNIDYFISLISEILNFKLFELNLTPVTLSSIMMFLFMMAIFFLFSRLLDRILLRNILDKFQLEKSTIYTILRVNHYLLITIGAVVSFQFIGIDLSGLAVIFGLLSVGIGFGLQNVTSNFVAGLILLFERPIKIGDRVTVGDTEGEVTAINIRSTTIRTLTNISIIVPNSEFVSSNVINWSHGDLKIRVDIEVGVSYNSDLEKVLEVLGNIADKHTGVLKNPKPDVLFVGFGDSSWNLLLRVWIENPKGHHIVRSDINCEIVRKFREFNIEIPFPQRDLHIKDNNPSGNNFDKQ